MELLFSTVVLVRSRILLWSMIAGVVVIAAKMADTSHATITIIQVLFKFMHVLVSQCIDHTAVLCAYLVS